MTGWTSTVNAALAALVSAFEASTDLADTAVSDGPAMVDKGTGKFLTVGHQANSTDDLAVNVETSTEGWANGPQRERFEVYCSASAFVGDDDQAMARGAAFPIYSAACAAIYADPTLGGVVMRAVPSSWILHQSATSQGRVATLNFSIAVDAYTT